MFYQTMNKKNIGVLVIAYKMVNLISFVFLFKLVNARHKIYLVFILNIICSITPY